MRLNEEVSVPEPNLYILTCKLTGYPSHSQEHRRGTQIITGL